MMDSGGVVRRRLESLGEARFLPRIWERDPHLWTRDPAHAAVIRNRLGWLSVAETMRGQVSRLQALAATLRNEGFRDVVVLGMGGSSLCPEVLRLSFSSAVGWPRLRVLDSTDPGAILVLQRSLDPGKTFFVVSSKSGTTTETDCFHRHFAALLRSGGTAEPGPHFAAITDPGTPLEAQARRESFREVFLNPPDIGGRYSALSFFGLVPAALTGVDVEALLDRAERVIRLSGPASQAAESPGLELGAALAEMALAGRDKVTLLAPPPVASFGLWAEQLLAESTGKEGKGLIPVSGEPLGSPRSYGEDRLFVALEMPGRDNGTQAALQALEAAGHPVVRLALSDPLDLGAEFFRWEMATAAAGSILGIDPFDEPNVQESKDNTRALLEVFRQSGKLPEEKPSAQERGLTFHADGAAGGAAAVLRSFLERIRPRDYFAVQAYLTPGDAGESLLQRIRLAVRDRLRVATTVGYGPRYLHSTGQLHKGGPGSGVFLQITSEDTDQLPIPGVPYGFATLKQAQALGDLQSLRRHGRRALRVHLSHSPADLEALAALVDTALASL